MIVKSLKYKEILDRVWQFCRSIYTTTEFPNADIQRHASAGTNSRVVINFMDNRQQMGFVGTGTLRFTFYTPLLNGRINTNWHEEKIQTLFNGLMDDSKTLLMRHNGLANIDDPATFDPYIDSFNPKESVQVIQFKIHTA